MRTLKKALCLVLVLAMVFTLAVPALAVDKASEYKDYSKVTNTEAVDVLTAIGVLNGNDDGTFGPEGNFTRAQAATIIAHMMLGSSATALLPVATGFSDVPATHWASGYIQYCVSKGIINGYGDGKFGPDDTLTATQWSLMLLGALGYNAKNEGIGGTGWEIATTSLAIQAGVASAEELTATFNRDMAAQLAFNTVCAPLVKYANNGASLNINGAQVNFGASAAEYVTTTVANEQTIYRNRLSNTSNAYTVEFGERYFPELRLTADTDAFGRPSHTWSYAKKDIGTYTDTEKLVASYTTTVKGGTVYSDIGSVASKFDLTYYVNGVALSASETKTVAADLVKGNTDVLKTTGNGVLTEVYVDTAEETLTIVEIHTYLAKVNADYNSKTDKVTLTVYTDVNKTGTPTEDTITRTVSGEKFAISEYEKDDMVKVTFAGTNRVIQSIADPEVLSEVQITAYSTYGKDATVDSKDEMKSITADGTKYSASKDAAWQAQYMYEYSLSQMKNHTWNVYLDSYGYVLGLENVESATNYAFMVGYEVGSSYLATAVDKALVIVFDGENNATMKVVEARANKLSSDDTLQLFGSSAARDHAAINKWITYTMDGDVMVVKSCVDEQFRDATTAKVSTSTTTLEGAKIAAAAGNFNGTNMIAYGNSKSVYVSVEADTTVSANGSIVKINATTTGIKNTSIDVKTAATANAKGAYVLYDANGYVKYAIVVGEDGSIADRLVYLTSGITQKVYDAELDKDIYYYDGIVAGEATEEVKSLVAEDTSNDQLVEGVLYVASFDANGLITEMVAKTDNWTTANTTNNKNAKYVQATATTATALNLKYQTLYITAATNNHYVILDDECVFFVRGTNEKGVRDSEYTRYDDASNALAALGKSSKFTGSFVAICDANTGYATTIIINDSEYEHDADTTTSDGWTTGTSNGVTYSYAWEDQANGQGLLYVDSHNVTVAALYTALGGTAIDGSYYTTDANGVRSETTLTATSTATVSSVMAQDDGSIVITNASGTWTVVTSK